MFFACIVSFPCIIFLMNEIVDVKMSNLSLLLMLFRKKQSFNEKKFLKNSVYLLKSNFIDNKMPGHFSRMSEFDCIPINSSGELILPQKKSFAQDPQKKAPSSNPLPKFCKHCSYVASDGKKDARGRFVERVKCRRSKMKYQSEYRDKYCPTYCTACRTHRCKLFNRNTNY